MAEKPLVWLGSALDDLRAFPRDARRIAGHQLHLVQQGLEPSDWKPMPTIATGVREIRIHTRVEHRVFYAATPPDAVYVLHAFRKHTRRTPPEALELARRRWRDVLADRQRRRGR